MKNLSLDLDTFETTVFYKSFTDQKYLASIIDYIRPHYFKDKDYKNIFTIIKIFFEKRNTLPSKTEILNYCTTSEFKDSLKNAINKIQKVDKNFNEDDLYASTEQFLKEKAVFHTMMEVVDKVTNNSVNTAEILEKFEESCSINLTQTLGIDLCKDIGVVINDLETIQPVISTGWKWLDERLDGGWLASGRALYLFAGETNVGKSIFLGNVATNIAKQGKTVIIISLEMSEMIYARRLASSIANIPLSNLRHETGLLKGNVETFFEKYPGGKVLIKEFPPSTVTPLQLSAFLKKLQSQGIAFDAVVLDYLNLLHSPIGSNSNERGKYITEQIRAFTYMFNVPFISATQLNRTGYNVSNPGVETIGESLAMAQAVDAMMSIWQEEDDRSLNIIRLGMMKNRFGSNTGSTQLQINYPTLTITEEDIPQLESVAATAINALDLLGDNS